LLLNTNQVSLLGDDLEDFKRELIGSVFIPRTLQKLILVFALR
jgi:hypothetical protein